jgi:molybdate transport system ATP-binding protein
MRVDEQWAMVGPNGSGKSLLTRAIAGQEAPVRGEVLHAWIEEGRHDSRIAPWDHEPPGTSPSPCPLPAARGEGGRRPGEGRFLESSGTRQPAKACPPGPSVALVSPHTHRAVVARESSFYQSRWHSGLDEGQLTVGGFLSQEHVEDINPFEVDPPRSPRRAFLKRRRETLCLLGLETLGRRKLIHLSSGEMRKTLLAHALLEAPRLLVLDEPFTGLDAATRLLLRRVVGQLMRDGLNVLVVTSRPEEIPMQATHLLLVQGHRVVAQGPKATLLRHPLLCQLRAAAARDPRSAPATRNHASRAERRSWPVLVDMRDITIRFGPKPILQHLTWQLRRGENWALLGPNGSGKTTLLSLIQGDNPQVYAQNIRLFGLSPDSTQALWQARQYVGWMSPELHLHYPPDCRCLEVVCSGFFDSIGLYQHCSARQQAQARQWLRRLGLGNVSGTALGELSLGDQRLVLLARAMVKRPRLLVLDEPCQGLDRRHRRTMLAVADQVVRTTGASLIFVTHHRDEMPPCITHQMRLKAGRVIEQGRRG